MDLNDISQKEFESIEAYLNGQLSNEDLITFENRLQNEESFAAKVDDIKTILSGIEVQSMKEQLDLFHKDLDNKETLKPETTNIRPLNWKKILVAAILIIAAGSFWFIRGNYNERLYAEYFTPDPGLPTTMGNNDNYEFYEAMVDYKQGDYETAISKWKDLLETKPKNDTINYFIGSALLANKKTNEAIDYFKTVTELDNTSFKDEAYFYLGLAYLKSDNSKATVTALKKTKFPKSKDLLKKLD